MRRIAVVGVGNSKFGVRSDASMKELAFEASKEALKDCGLDLKDVDAMVTATASDEFSFSLQPSAQIHDYLGFHPKPNFRVEGACASGSVAIRTAFMTIASGFADVVLALGVEKMTEVDTARATEIMSRGGDVVWEYPFGVSFPGYYALIAQAHMARYETTEEQLAMVAVKNHHYGAMNPVAHMQKEVSLEEALSSRMIAYPLKLFDCSLITDGAAAVILASEEKAREFLKEPVWVAGLGLGTDSLSLCERRDLTSLAGAAYAADQAYRMSGIGPDEVDVACVHDCFTIAEIVAYEDLGFCKRGEGGRLIEEKQTYIEGKIPVNVDGGLKSKGHPVGATGVSMTVEITRQLRGEATPRQVHNAEIGLIHNVGGSGQIAAVNILRRG